MLQATWLSSAVSTKMRYSSSQPPSMDVWPATAQFIQDLIVNNSSMVNDGSAEVLSNLFKAISMDGSTRSMLEFDELPSFPPVRSTFSTWSSFDYTTERNTNYLRRLSTITGDGSTNSFIVNIVLVFVCIICAGFASGLTQGLLSLDLTEMTIKSRSGTPKEKIYADRLIPIISRHHLLIVTLMLWNVTATEALPIFLSGLVPEYLALIISVILVLFFGEIIPAAILTGQYDIPPQFFVLSRRRTICSYCTSYLIDIKPPFFQRILSVPHLLIIHYEQSTL